MHCLSIICENHIFQNPTSFLLLLILGNLKIYMWYQSMCYEIYDSPRMIYFLYRDLEQYIYVIFYFHGIVNAVEQTFEKIVIFYTLSYITFEHYFNHFEFPEFLK